MENRWQMGMNIVSYPVCYLLVYPVSGDELCALSFINGVPFSFADVPVYWAPSSPNSLV